MIKNLQQNIFIVASRSFSFSIINIMLEYLVIMQMFKLFIPSISG